MKITMQESPDATELSYGKWAVGVVGPMLDDRGTFASDFVQENCAKIISVAYDADDFIVNINNKARMQSEEFIDFFSKSTVAGPVLLDSTTMGFVEILLCLKALKESAHSATDVLYVEPLLYRVTDRDPLLNRRDFELSDEVPGYRGIPGFTLLLQGHKKIRSVFF